MENTTKKFYEVLTALVELETAITIAEAEEDNSNGE